MKCRLSAALLSLFLRGCDGFTVHRRSPRFAALTAHRQEGAAESSSPSHQQVIAGLLSLAAPFQFAFAISGGGLDFASSDISKRDFSSGDYSKKDFSGSVANEATFKNSVLRGSRFYKADLKDSDFTGADCNTAGFDEADLSGVNFKDAVLMNAYFTGSTLEAAASIENADFSDAVINPTVQKKLCKREDAKGTNAKTGTDTRESLMCIE
jgi:uncharacterized protein YjbI with pentapeptide repeats